MVLSDMCLLEIRFQLRSGRCPGFAGFVGTVEPSQTNCLFTEQIYVSLIQQNKRDNAQRKQLQQAIGLHAWKVSDFSMQQSDIVVWSDLRAFAPFLNLQVPYNAVSDRNRSVASAYLLRLHGTLSNCGHSKNVANIGQNLASAYTSATAHCGFRVLDHLASRAAKSHNLEDDSARKELHTSEQSHNLSTVERAV